MLEKLSKESEKLITDLNELCEEGIVGYPIMDYDGFVHSDEDLAESLGHWFGSDKWKENGNSFVQFGHEASGSMFLLWFYPGLVGEPPVVFVDSEGDSCFVAKDIKSFIMQIGSGEIFMCGEWLAYEDRIKGVSEEVDEEYFSTLKLRVEAIVGPITKTPEEIRNEGISSCPNFSDWVDSCIQD